MAILLLLLLIGIAILWGVVSFSIRDHLYLKDRKGDPKIYRPPAGKDQR